MKFKFCRKYNVYGDIVRDLDFALILKSFIKLEKEVIQTITSDSTFINSIKCSETS